MASFPTTAITFATRSNGQTIDASHVNSLQDEVAAIEAGYLDGTARLNSSNSTVATLSVTGGSTVGALKVTGALLVPTASTTLSGGSTRFDNVVVPSTTYMLIVNPNSTTIAISGFSGGAAGRVIYIVNTDGAASVTLQHGGANSSADCQMTFTGNTNKSLGTQGTAMLVHDGSFWRGL